MLRGTGACLVSRARLRSQRSEALGGVASICMGSGAALGVVGVGVSASCGGARVGGEAGGGEQEVVVGVGERNLALHVVVESRRPGS